MFDNIKKCLKEYEEVRSKFNKNQYLSKEEEYIIEHLDLHLAEAIMKDYHYDDMGEKIAKIILASLGVSNEIKVKIE